jgi:hypothetical protein
MTYTAAHQGDGTMDETTEQEIDRLLHDAEHADAGSEFAARIGHTEPARELREKRDKLIDAAISLDPQQTARAWKETRLVIPQGYAR